MDDLTFTCPVCGSEVPRRAKSCPDCGACEKSGWSGDTYLDGVFLPGEDDDYGHSAPRRLGGPAKKPATQWLWIIVAIVLVISFVLFTIHSMG